MPDRKRVEMLIQYLMQQKYLEAMDEFYHTNVKMQENSCPIRFGRTTSIERLKKADELTRETHEFNIKTVTIDGDHVAIEMHADWTFVNGKRVRIEQVAMQTWQDDKIIFERFFYDPAPILEAGITLL